jgi:hypothetical protein
MSAPLLTIVYDFVVLPAITRATDVVIGFANQLGTIVQVETRSLDVVEFKAVLFKDTTHTRRLDPQQGSKENVKASSENANERGSAIDSISYNIENYNMRKICTFHAMIAPKTHKDDTTI